LVGSSSIRENPPGKLFGFGAPSFLGVAPVKANHGPVTLHPKPLPGKPVELADGGARPVIKPTEPALAEISSEDFADVYGPGSIVIDTAHRKLYYILSPKLAYVYPIAVGKEGFAWTGTEIVTKVVDWPEWMPPDEMRARKPELPIKMTGGLRNPLGAKAIYLGKSLYRIHGTNDPRSIGQAAFSGCFRMHNKHVTHLAGLVTAKVTQVHVLKNLAKGTLVEIRPQNTKPRTARSSTGRNRAS
jgi:lipoprotein-anchoring transpeptidase ErfK/SrfK